jgi:hypothetical protein
MTGTGLRAAAVVLALSAAGCIGGWRREYPSTWPRRVEGAKDECPDLTGSWQNRAEEDPFVSRVVNLRDALIRSSPPSKSERQARAAEEAVMRVKLTGPVRDDLQVVFTAIGTGQPKAATLRRGRDFECEAGVLTVKLPSDGFQNANICAAVTWDRTALARDESGALVARTSDRTLCLGLATGYVWSAEWSRFRPAGTSGTESAPR